MHQLTRPPAIVAAVLLAACGGAPAPAAAELTPTASHGGHALASEAPSTAPSATPQAVLAAPPPTTPLPFTRLRVFVASESADSLVVLEGGKRFEVVGKEELRFAGRYPFHTMKRGRDGAFFPPEGTPMLLSDHGGPSLLFVDVAARRIASATKLGQQPFHTTYDPLGGRLLVTSNVASEVAAIDLAAREVVQRVTVTAPHGIVAVGIP